MINVQQTAANLAFQWKAAYPMSAATQVREAVEVVAADGDISRDPWPSKADIDAITAALLPLLRRDGTLLDSEAIDARIDAAVAEDDPMRALRTLRDELVYEFRHDRAAWLAAERRVQEQIDILNEEDA